MRDRESEPGTWAITIKLTKRNYGTFAIEFKEKSKNKTRHGYHLRGDDRNWFRSIEDLVQFFAKRRHPALRKVRLRIGTPKISVLH